jgi:hypothetical protein
VQQQSFAYNQYVLFVEGSQMGAERDRKTCARRYAVLGTSLAVIRIGFPGALILDRRGDEPKWSSPFGLANGREGAPSRGLAVLAMPVIIRAASALLVAKMLAASLLKRFRFGFLPALILGPSTLLLLVRRRRDLLKV